MSIPAYYTQRQIVRIEATGVTTANGNVVYTFRSHPYVNTPYNGLVIVRLLAVPTGATTEPIVFNTNGQTQNLIKAGGGNAVANDIAGEGVYLIYYDSSRGIIQLV